MTYHIKRTREYVEDEIAAYLAMHLKPHMDPAHYARCIVEETDGENGVLRFEISGRHTKSGNPIPCEFDAPSRTPA